MEKSNTCHSMSASSSHSSNTSTPSSSLSAGIEGHHDKSEPRIGISLVDQGNFIDLTTSSNLRAYIHTGYLSSDFSPVSLVTPGYEYELDDISGSPPPSSSPIQEPLSYEDENEETTSHSSSGSCIYPPGSIAHAGAESAHILDCLRTNQTLSTEKSLSRSQSIVGNSSEGRFHNYGTLPLEDLGENVEEEPPTKRARTGYLASDRPDLLKIRTHFLAKEPASLRRAQSLVSQTSTDRDDEGVVKLLDGSNPSTGSLRPTILYRTTQLDSLICPPTVPATPLPDTVGYLRAKRNPLLRTPAVRAPAKQSPKIPPVPIIAPPRSPSPFIIKCEEDRAGDRIKILLTKEREERKSDGLDLLQIPDDCSTRSESESSVSDDEYWTDESSLSASESESVASRSSGPSLGTGKSQSRERWSRALGLDYCFREEVVSWMLDVLPNIPPMKKDCVEIDDLFDQLDTCRNTRFHAVHLFYRYFFRVADKKPSINVSAIASPARSLRGRNDSSTNRKASSSEDSSDESTGEDSDDELDAGSDDTVVVKGEQVSGYESESDNWQDGQEAVIWDTALGSLALCVKFHRDFLGPLSPVYAYEFLDLARHTISYQDLEVSQRDILSACDFSLGSITPQGLMDELWLALPTLRKATEPVKDGWKSVQVEIWNRLFDALTEPDVLQFPVSLLTASALLDGLIIAIALHYTAEADMEKSRFQRNSGCRCPAPSTCMPENTTKQVPWRVYVSKAMDTVKDVVLDVTDVLQIRDDDLERCRAWMIQVGCE
ncbi:hypothetical protein DFJ58DRAFT_678805 [Suillus subalutaceus]|uniref:uncharacterized protein n=1 Tax=Suillus subalutaceus TaxID=48586 RepID=UPI001B87D671|nr:uncharacterized protein DFJ58DRAFT_678805 [Suillus subalutaceus]KAG1868381.1 hypothetical protein DFJ58DRAFT_678805 [Suillus subalutaceus]